MREYPMTFEEFKTNFATEEQCRDQCQQVKRNYSHDVYRWAKIPVFNDQKKSKNVILNYWLLRLSPIIKRNVFFQMRTFSKIGDKNDNKGKMFH